MDIHASPQVLVKVGSHRRLNLSIMGAGLPVVVLFAGGGGSTLDWAKVMPGVAQTACVAAFDRAGLGFSDPGPRPRTVAADVADLRAALRAAALPPPYVLVGASWGGLEIAWFAFQHPQELAGLIFVDPSPVGHMLRVRQTPHVRANVQAQHADLLRVERMARAGAFRPGTPEFDGRMRPDPSLSPALREALLARWASPTWWRTYRSHQVSAQASMETVETARRSLGDLPLILLGTPMHGLEDWAKVSMKRDHADIVALSSRGEWRIVDSGHNIPWDQPGGVVDAIRDVLTRVHLDSLTDRSAQV